MDQSTVTRLDALNEIVKGIQATNDQYAVLLKFSKGIQPQPPYPIPYFGNPVTARIATVGLHPASSEFLWERWPEKMTTDQLDKRLIHYFRCPAIPAHSWFWCWEYCLKMLDHSYRTDAVHLDLSPRATGPKQEHKKLFKTMVEADLEWFIKSLALCKDLAGVLMAGKVMGTDFDKFLKRPLQRFCYSLSPISLSQENTGRIRMYHLIGPSRKLPVFFCDRSPSAPDGGVILADKIRNAYRGGQLKAIGFHD